MPISRSLKSLSPVFILMFAVACTPLVGNSSDSGSDENGERRRWRSLPCREAVARRIVMEDDVHPILGIAALFRV